MKRWMMSGILALSLFTLVGAQNGDYLPKQGDILLGTYFSGASSAAYFKLGDVSTTRITLTLDYFFTSNFSFTPYFSFSETRNGQSDRNTSFGAGVGYYFGSPGSNVLPYIKAFFTTFDPDTEPDLTGFIVSGGAHIFLSETVSVNLDLSYLNVRGGGRTETGFGIGVGFGFWFK